MLLLFWRTVVITVRVFPGNLEEDLRSDITPAANAAVSDLVELSEKLASEGQFHTALAIYDELERLV